jgi:hypothetical protein
MFDMKPVKKTRCMQALQMRGKIHGMVCRKGFPFRVFFAVFTE